MDTIKLDVIAVIVPSMFKQKYVRGDPRNIAFVGK